MEELSLADIEGMPEPVSAQAMKPSGGSGLPCHVRCCSRRTAAAREVVPGVPVVCRMSSAFFARMEHQALVQGGSATHFLLTALAGCFGRTHADGGQVVIGLERANRHTIQQQQTCIGALARTMPVGIRLDGCSS